MEIASSPTSYTHSMYVVWTENESIYFEFKEKQLIRDMSETNFFLFELFDSIGECAMFLC